MLKKVCKSTSHAERGTELHRAMPESPILGVMNIKVVVVVVAVVVLVVVVVVVEQ